MALPLVFCSSTINPKSFLSYPKLTSLINKNNRSNSIIFSSVRSIREKNSLLHFPCISRTRTYFSLSNYQDLNEDEEEILVQDLRVPSHWLIPSNALKILYSVVQKMCETLCCLFLNAENHPLCIILIEMIYFSSIRTEFSISSLMMAISRSILCLWRFLLGFSNRYYGKLGLSHQI
ncbi:hypothetical protein MKX03_009616 [Papaver bracteatum]|nr:hypothetical protein MKX03_009616 [Papaver bracteatum]